jgi:8-oxo-dGTP diphosphatase
MSITELDGAVAGVGDDSVRIETERLLLRPLEPGDADAVRPLVGNWDVARFLPHVPYPYGPGAAEDWIGHTRRGLAAGSEVTLAVTCKEDAALVGAISLNLSLHGRSAELGYWIGRPYWGHGYATEAAAAMLRHGFERLGLQRVGARTLGHNKPSLRVLEKLGLRFEREGSSDFGGRGGVRKVAIHGITRVQHRERTGPATASDGAGTEEPRVQAVVPLVLVAAVALVDPDGRVLLAERPAGKLIAGLWEFPGGKVRAGETPEAALIRELKEELGIDTAHSCLAPFTFASHRYADFHLLMPLYVCRRWQGAVAPREGQRIAWVRPPRLGDYPMPPADRPLVAMLRDFL